MKTTNCMKNTSYPASAGKIIELPINRPRLSAVRRMRNLRKIQKWLGLFLLLLGVLSSLMCGDWTVLLFFAVFFLPLLLCRENILTL